MDGKSDFNKESKIVIIGLGVIGGSYAMALTQAGCRNVYGVDLCIESVDKAKSLGIIAGGGTSANEFVKDADIVVVAVYPDNAQECMRSIAPHLKDGTVVTDVAGIKSGFIDKIGKLLPEGVRYVPAHPMAGREKKGFNYADAKVFNGANFIITPADYSDSESVSVVSGMARAMGFGRISVLSPNEHDRIVAYTSQLPHALAVSLINSDSEGSQTGDFIGDSYRDLTRIADINSELWQQLFIGNKDNLLSVIEDFERHLDEIKDAIKRGDKIKLQSIFHKSSSRRSALNK